MWDSPDPEQPISLGLKTVVKSAIYVVRINTHERIVPLHILIVYSQLTQFQFGIAESAQPALLCFL